MPPGPDSPDILYAITMGPVLCAFIAPVIFYSSVFLEPGTITFNGLHWAIVAVQFVLPPCLYLGSDLPVDSREMGAWGRNLKVC